MLTPREARVIKLGLPVLAAASMSLEDIVMLEGPEECVRYAFQPTKNHKLCIPHLIAFFKSFKVKTGKNLRVWAEIFGGIMHLDAMETKLEAAAIQAELLQEVIKYKKFIKA